MNYYPFHLGDYAADTSHLEPMEDLAYRRMLDLYYRTEKPLPEPSEIARLIRMRDHAATIRDVLNEFFVSSPDGFRHARCDAEIAKMQDKQAKAKASAQASVNARSASAQRTLNERSTKLELPTPTPTPTENTNPPSPRKRGSAGVAGFDVFWEAYPRKANKAQALKRFETIAPDAELLDEMLQAIARQRSWDQWAKDGGKFIPHPASWLNGERWKDEQPAVRVVPFESDKTRSARHAFEQWSGRNTSEVIDAEPTIRALG